MISFVEITKDNWRECISLTVTQEQQGFVASNLYSLAESKFEPEMCPVGICKDNKLVGFAMYGNEKEANKSWIIRFMITKEHQGKGIGKEALNCLTQFLLNKYPENDIRLCVEPENNVAINLYTGFGFIFTGNKLDNELIYEYKKSAFQ